MDQQNNDAEQSSRGRGRGRCQGRPRRNRGGRTQPCTNQDRQTETNVAHPTNIIQEAQVSYNYLTSLKLLKICPVVLFQEIVAVAVPDNSVHVVRDRQSLDSTDKRLQTACATRGVHFQWPNWYSSLLAAVRNGNIIPSNITTCFTDPNSTGN